MDESDALLQIDPEKDCSGFPEVEKDMAPSAVIPAATKCVGKHIKKLGLLLEKFTGRLTENQQKCLAL